MINGQGIAEISYVPKGDSFDIFVTDDKGVKRKYVQDIQRNPEGKYKLTIKYDPERTIVDTSRLKEWYTSDEIINLDWWDHVTITNQDGWDAYRLELYARNPFNNDLIRIYTGSSDYNISAYDVKERNVSLYGEIHNSKIKIIDEYPSFHTSKRVQEMIVTSYEYITEIISRPVGVRLYIHYQNNFDGHDTKRLFVEVFEKFGGKFLDNNHNTFIIPKGEHGDFVGDYENGIVIGALFNDNAFDTLNITQEMVEKGYLRNRSIMLSGYKREYLGNILSTSYRSYNGMTFDDPETQKYKFIEVIRRAQFTPEPPRTEELPEYIREKIQSQNIEYDVWYKSYNWNNQDLVYIGERSEIASVVTLRNETITVLEDSQIFQLAHKSVALRTNDNQSGELYVFIKKTRP